jgi:hypothetical protein
LTPGVFENSGRNILIGPGFQPWDLSLLKNFRVRETRNLQFRAESFNVFNHTNFTGINTTVRFEQRQSDRRVWGGTRFSDAFVFGALGVWRLRDVHLGRRP